MKTTDSDVQKAQVKKTALRRKQIFWAIIIVGSFVGYWFLAKQPFFIEFMGWVQQYFWWHVSVLVLIKVIGLVWPPLPGGIFVMASVPVIGWVAAFWVHAFGVTLGSIISYWIGWKYGMKIVENLFGHEMVEKIRQYKIRHENSHELVLIGKTVAGSIGEVINYGAGVLKIPFWKFFWGSMMSLIPSVLTFYLIDAVFNDGIPKWYYGIIALVFVGAVAFDDKWFWRRYFE